MRSWGKTPLFIAALNCSVSAIANAEETIPAGGTVVSSPSAVDSAANTSLTPATNAVPSVSSKEGSVTTVDSARDALKQKSTDSNAEKDLEKVFQSAEKNYSLLKKNKFAMNYDVSYSYYRDKQIDIALSSDDSSIARLRIQDDSQHSFSNTIDVSYGFRDNLTLNMAMPLVFKLDTAGSKETVGLGDVSMGVRWQPVPLKRGLPTTTLYSSLSLATGDSPFEVNSTKDLSTGKGYYSLSAGVSVSKITDPIVMYGSAGLTIGNATGNLNQAQSGRILTSFTPGQTLSTSFGFAYSLNYDVSMSASYQQSISANTRYGFSDGTSFNAATQLSALLNYTLSMRTSPTRVVNVSVGFGLSEDTPDVNLGFSMPLEFLGIAQD